MFSKFLVIFFAFSIVTESNNVCIQIALILARLSLKPLKSLDDAQKQTNYEYWKK